jgi:hypothetical protein
MLDALALPSCQLAFASWKATRELAKQIRKNELDRYNHAQAVVP